MQGLGLVLYSGRQPPGEPETGYLRRPHLRHERSVQGRLRKAGQNAETLPREVCWQRAPVHRPDGIAEPEGWLPRFHLAGAFEVWPPAVAARAARYLQRRSTDGGR